MACYFNSVGVYIFKLRKNTKEENTLLHVHVQGIEHIKSFFYLKKRGWVMHTWRFLPQFFYCVLLLWDDDFRVVSLSFSHTSLTICCSLKSYQDLFFQFLFSDSSYSCLDCLFIVHYCMV